MGETNNGAEFLKQKYGLHNTPEVASAARRTEARTGEKVPQNPVLRIENYLDRFREIIEREDPAKRERGIEALKRVLHSEFVIKPEEIPEGYWENQRRLVRERGQGADLEMVDWQELQAQNSEAIIADQRSSLDNWVDYLASPDATYPDWLKYWTMRNVLGLAKYDKDKKKFPKRTLGTTNPFPELNREALAYVLDAIEKKYKDETPTFVELEAEEQQKFEQLLKGESFAKLYAWAVEKVIPASAEALVSTRGEWVKYPQDSDHLPLVQSIQGHGTGWCTAGESTAQIQLQGGDFYIYYSLDQNGKPTIPRVAIRMEGGNIAEVRGIAEEQNLDPYIGDVVENKLRDFPDGIAYKKKVNDMKRLTAIEYKMQEGEELDRQELLFLYEIDSQIDGFGYHRDPRIADLRGQRDPEVDMPVLFGCSRHQIARGVDEINQDTKAYVGELVPGIFDRLSDRVEHICIPEGKIGRETAEIGGKSAKELLEEMKKNNQITRWATDMINSSDFTTLRRSRTIHLVLLRVADLGLTGYPTTEQLYRRAEELGLELCPAEVGPHYRLQNKDQLMGDWRYVAMKQIADTAGYPRVFELARTGDGLRLHGHWAYPDRKWFPEVRFLFSLRKQES